jgi:hypothetical protein
MSKPINDDDGSRNTNPRIQKKKERKKEKNNNSAHKK